MFRLHSFQCKDQLKHWQTLIQMLFMESLKELGLDELLILKANKL